MQFDNIDNLVKIKLRVPLAAIGWKPITRRGLRLIAYAPSRRIAVEAVAALR